MPRPRQAMGRPGTPVIPAGWGQSHSQVMDRATEGASIVTIGTPGGESHWDEGLGRTVTTPATPVYAGRASLQPVSDAARLVVAAEDEVELRTYEVTLPYAATAAVEAEMVITVDPSDPDPMLAGKTLTVKHIERGSRRFSRTLLAVLLD